MAKQDAFTGEEWTQLRLVPVARRQWHGRADPSGLFSSLKESLAGAKGVAEAFKTNSTLELFAALAADRSIPGHAGPEDAAGRRLP